MKILVLDNYDSFTYNLVYLLRELGYSNDLVVIRNDKMTVDEVDEYDKILLSPGPGIPAEAGIMKEVIERYAPTKSILGVCLGHQGIAEVFGAELFNMTEVLHGAESTVTVTDKEEGLFNGLPESFTTGLYHSWAVKNETINGMLKVTALNDRNLVMGIRHLEYDVRGLQFHPESIMTGHGKTIIENWLKSPKQDN